MPIRPPRTAGAPARPVRFVASAPSRSTRPVRHLLAGLLAAATLLAGVTACTGDSTDPPPSSANPATPTTPSPSPTPSPTPTGPVPAPDDPTWTADQVAAAHIVDAYYVTLARYWIDPPNFDRSQWLTVLTDPWYTWELNASDYTIGRGTKGSGDLPIIPVSRTVQPETTVDGRREIHVTQCNVDNPSFWLVDNSTTHPSDGAPVNLYDYAVQWVDVAQGWRIAQITKVREGC